MGSPANMQKPVLLLVEDQEDDAFFFCRTFEEAKVDCVLRELDGGAAAIEFLRKDMAANPRPGIMFLDLKMPVVNGFDVLTWMKKENIGVKIPVVVLSGSDDAKDKERAKELGAVDYVVKPINSQRLAKIVKTLVTNVAEKS